MAALLSTEFVSLQLLLVDRFVELGLGTQADGVHRLTNFQRRLGLGTPIDPPSPGTWTDLLGRIRRASSHAERVETVMGVLASVQPAVPEHIVRGWPTAGAFSIEISGTAARTHFYAFDDDGTSPLHPSKHHLRRHELLSVLTTTIESHPQIDRVVGGSWLYTMASYASLFPSPHVANADVRRGRSTFRGMSHWGQFLDHRWNLRTDMAEQFLQRVAKWTGDDPCLLFPRETLEVSSPITLFDLPAI
jgi:hypothetical protein